MAQCSPTLMQRIEAWFGSASMAEQQQQNLTLPQAYECQTFPTDGVTTTTVSPAESVCATQKFYTAINSCTINQIGDGLKWIFKVLETYFILVVIILALLLFFFVIIKESD